MGALQCVCQLYFGEKLVPEQSQPPRLGGTAMASQNSVLGQTLLFRAIVWERPGVVIVARTCTSKYAFHITFVDGWKTILKSGKRSSGALVAPRRSTDNSRTLLLPCSKVVVDPCDLSHGSPEGGSGTGKAAWAEKTVSKGSSDTARATSKFPEQATKGIGGLQRCHLLFRCFRKLRRF